MKIAFICNTLEIGKSGIGDYTRLMAEALVARGNSCPVLAVSDLTEGDVPKHERLTDVQRVKQNAEGSDRVMDPGSRIGRWVSDQNPDWLSIQFVPYAYDRRGFSFKLCSCLRAVPPKVNVHVMMHELWLDCIKGAPFKNRLLGTIQRYSILRMFRRIKPSLVHTSNRFYQEVLSRYGTAAMRLPVFGNLPISKKNADGWLLPQLRNNGVKINEMNRSDYLLFGFFGSIYPSWSPSPFFRGLKVATRQNGKTPVVISIGKMKQEKNIWSEMKKAHGDWCTFHRMGFLAPDQASEILHSLDYGIATTPREAIGKSGSFAAMVEHGLPVIAADAGIAPRWMGDGWIDEDTEIVIAVDGKLEDKLACGIKKRPTESRLVNAVDIFVKDMKQNSKDAF